MSRGAKDASEGAVRGQRQRTANAEEADGGLTATSRKGTVVSRPTKDSSQSVSERSSESSSKSSSDSSSDSSSAGASVGSSVGDIARRISSPFVAFLVTFGEHMMMLGDAARWLLRRPFRWRLFVDQMDFIGVGSMPIVLLVGFFSGAVAALQGINALSIFNQERWVGVTVGISLAEELAPVFTGLMVTARAGSGIATELGSMRTTEQIDAITTFAVNPVQYLITPRLVSATLMMPVMTMAFNIIGLTGAYIVSIVIYDLDFGQVTGLFSYWVEGRHYGKGLIKSAVFGLALALAACFRGFNVRGGAKEVGMATTRSVVTGSVSILVLDYFLIEILNMFFPTGRQG